LPAAKKETAKKETAKKETAKKEMKHSIRSLDELYKVAICSEEMSDHIKMLIQDSEEVIIKALQTREDNAIIPILYNSYNLVSFTPEETVKILSFNIIKVMNDKNYPVKLIKKNKGYYIIINLKSVANSALHKQLDNYLSQFL
jgi:hypothetical protein